MPINTYPPASTGGGGTTTNSLTFNNGGAGAASGATFDGSAARTISFNTLGAYADTNPSGYITSSALSPYLTSATAASTYQPIGTYLTNASIGSTVQAYSANLTSWAALSTSAKQDALVSGTNIKTVNSNSLLGSGDVAVGTVTSVSGTGSVSGITLSGTVTSSGSLTLGGSLDLSSPPAIGGTAPNSGAFTTLSSTGNTTLGDATTDTLDVANGTLRTDGLGNVGIGTTPDNSSLLQIAAGTNSKAPLEFISSAGTVMTVPDDGSLEYDGKTFYGTPTANSRGVWVTEHFICRTATRTLANNTSLQSIFAGSTGATNGALTVSAATTYFFEASINMSSMSGTSGNIGFSIVGAGTATFTSAAWHAIGLDATAQTTAAAVGGIWSSASAQTGNIVTAAAGTAVSVLIKGVFRINAAGTIIPSVQQTNAAAAVIGVNTWFKCYPVGSNTAIVVGNWS